MGTASRRRPEKLPAAAQPVEADVAAGKEGLGQEKPLRPSQCKKYLQKMVAAAFRDIVGGFIDQAKSGSVQHLKMATEVVEPEKRMRAAARVKGPAEMMLEELEREDRELAAAAVEVR